jgi:hypothetical protein
MGEQLDADESCIQFMKRAQTLITAGRGTRRHGAVALPERSCWRGGVRALPGAEVRQALRLAEVVAPEPAPAVAARGIARVVAHELPKHVFVWV